MPVRHHPGRRDVTVLLAFLIVVALAVGPLTTRADAGSFTVRTCHGSSNQTVPIGGDGYGWEASTIGIWAGYGPTPVNRCGERDDGLVAINDRSVTRQANSGLGWVYRAAPGTSISAYKIWMHAGARAFTDGSDGSVVVQSAPFASYDRTLGFDGAGGLAGAVDLTSSPWVDVSGRNVSAVQVWAICGGPPGAFCSGGLPQANNSYFWLYRAQMTTTDNSAPSSSAASGDAIDSSVWHGSPSLAFNATDTGSGVYRVLVQAGANAASLTTRSVRVLDANNGQCRDENPANDDPYEFTSPQPCASSVSSDMQFDSAGLPDGSQSVRVQIEDAAGNRSTVYGPVTKTVDNLAPTIGPVTVAGPAAREGETVTCAATVAGQSPTITFRWLRSNADGSAVVEIPGAVGATHVLDADEIGGKVRCELTAVDAGGRVSGTSALTDGPFGNGAVVVGYCSGRPTGPRDECGDLDGDGTINRLDDDIDGDGATNGIDPDPWDPAVRQAVVTEGGGNGGGGGTPGAPGMSGDVGKAGDAGVQGETGRAAPGGGTVVETARVDQNVVPVTNPTTGSGLNGTPADDEAVVVAYFERGSGKSRTVSGTATAGMKERLRIRGTLKTHDGKPIIGAKVFLAQKSSTGAWKVDGGTVSRQDGSLLMFTRKGGTTRQLRLVYFPRDGRDANRGSATLSLKLRQSAALSLSRTRLHNRDTLRFTGRVDGTVAGRGPLVQVQVKLPAGWSTFASTRATKARHGKFAVPYRFLRTTRRTIYRFRVRVVPTTASGYVGGMSKVRAVVVSP